MYICICVYVYICIYVYMYICYTCIHMYTCIYVYTCIHMYVYILMGYMTTGCSMNKDVTMLIITRNDRTAPRFYIWFINWDQQDQPGKRETSGSILANKYHPPVITHGLLENPPFIDVFPIFLFKPRCIGDLPLPRLMAREGSVYNFEPWLHAATKLT